MDEKYLSDEEKELVVQFIGNEKMAEAVKKVLLSGLYDNGVLIPDQKAVPTKNFALSLFFKEGVEGPVSNEQLGADLRSCGAAISILESSFSKMLNFGKDKGAVKSPIQNPAR